MAGVVWDEKSQSWIAGGGLDTGYIAGTQPGLLARGIDTSDEIVTWYATEGQKAGVPANYNEQLAREAGYQGNFEGGGDWQNEVVPFYESGGDNASLNPIWMRDESGKAVIRQDPADYYTASGTPPSSNVWFGDEAVDTGWIYQNVVKDGPVIREGTLSAPGATVLGGREMFWDPDVTGGAASAGIMDHRMIEMFSPNIRTADSDYTRDTEVHWYSTKDAPYNNFAFIDELVADEYLGGRWNDRTAAEREALAAGAYQGLGVKDLFTGRAVKPGGGYEVTADDWAEEIYPMTAAVAAQVNPRSVDPGYFTGGSRGNAGLPGKRTVDRGHWADIPGLDKFVIPGSFTPNIDLRRRINDFYGRADRVLLPSDHASYQLDLNRGPPQPDPPWFTSMGGSGTPPERGSSEFDPYRPARDRPDDDNPRDDVEDSNVPPSIFTNSVTGYDDDFLFRPR